MEPTRGAADLRDTLGIYSCGRYPRITGWSVIADICL